MNIKLPFHFRLKSSSEFKTGTKQNLSSIIRDNTLSMREKTIIVPFVLMFIPLDIIICCFFKSYKDIFFYLKPEQQEDIKMLWGRWHQSDNVFAWYKKLDGLLHWEKIALINKFFLGLNIVKENFTLFDFIKEGDIVIDRNFFVGRDHIIEFCSKTSFTYMGIVQSRGDYLCEILSVNHKRIFILLDHPPAMLKPSTSVSACSNCNYFHGKTYGGKNYLHCAIHPYGFDDIRCSDFQD